VHQLCKRIEEVRLLSITQEIITSKHGICDGDANSALARVGTKGRKPVGGEVSTTHRKMRELL
jgi:hypothetical protein